MSPINPSTYTLCVHQVPDTDLNAGDTELSLMRKEVKGMALFPQTKRRWELWGHQLKHTGDPTAHSPDELWRQEVYGHRKYVLSCKYIHIRWGWTDTLTASCHYYPKTAADPTREQKCLQWLQKPVMKTVARFRALFREQQRSLSSLSPYGSPVWGRKGLNYTLSLWSAGEKISLPSKERAVQVPKLPL